MMEPSPSSSGTASSTHQEYAQEYFPRVDSLSTSQSNKSLTSMTSPLRSFSAQPPTQSAAYSKFQKVSHVQTSNTTGKTKTNASTRNPSKRPRSLYWSMMLAISLVLIQFWVWESSPCSTQNMSQDAMGILPPTAGLGQTISSLSKLSSSSFPLPHLSKESLIVIVLSRRTDFDQRQAIRNTWGSNHASHIYFVIGQPCTIPLVFRPKDEGGNELCGVAPIVLPKDYRQLVRKQIQGEQEVTRRLLEEQDKFQDLLMMDQIDMYRTLPAKLKYAYRFVDAHVPSAEWVVKVDDDFYMRLDAFEAHLKESFGKPDYNPMKDPIVVGGDIWMEHAAMTEGKWVEVPQWENGKIYPSFPVGSYGHAVSRPIVEYIAREHETLFEYQGEDNSLGIWLDHPEAPMTTFAQSLRMRSDGDCRSVDDFVIGHGITLLRMKRCWQVDQTAKQKAGTKDTNPKATTTTTTITGGAAPKKEIVNKSSNRQLSKQWSKQRTLFSMRRKNIPER